MAEVRDAGSGEDQIEGGEAMDRSTRLALRTRHRSATDQVWMVTDPLATVPEGWLYDPGEAGLTWV